MRKTLRLLVLFLLLTALVLPVTAFAEGVEEMDGLSVEIVTDRNSYKEGGPINLSVNVTNDTDADLQNIQVEFFLPTGLECMRGSISSTRLDVSAGATSGLAAELAVQEDADIFRPVEIDRSDASAKRGKVPVISIVIAGVLAAGIITAVVFMIVKPQKKVKIICIVLSAAMLLGYVPLGIFTFKPRDVIMYADKTILVNGEKAQIVAKVTKYQDKHSQRVSIDMGNALYDTKQDLYHINKDVRTLKGYLFNEAQVKSATVTVRNEIDKLLLEKEFTPAHEFSIEEFGLIVGINKVEFSIIHKDGFQYKEEFTINNLLEENMENLDVDKGDDDKDGVLNFIEEIKGTDPDKADTDSDKLSDYYEIGILGTDPLKKDTDGNRVSDADEDADYDGLTNIDEIDKFGTDPATPDTDLDGLDDKKELEETHTDPVKEDTDSDGKTDGWELDKGYDPLVPDEEFPKFEAESNVEEIQIEADGEASVTEVVGDLNLNEEIPGAIGVPPFEVSLEKGSEATIRIEYDPEVLEGEDPTLYEYDEQTQIFEEVEEAIVEETTVTFTTTKSGKYILLNHRYMEDVWENDILRPSEHDPDAPIDIVFVIDRSGSMDQNDPNGYRKEATKGFITKLRADKDRAGIVQFSTTAQTVIPLSNDKQSILNAIDTIENATSSCDDNSGTNGSAGLREAFNQLEGSTAKYKFIIFLTDGADTTVSEEYGDSAGTTGLTREAREKGIVIHTVGLIGSGDVDVDLLKTVAAGAKGNYYVLTVSEDGAELEAQFFEVYDDIRGDTIDRQLDSNNDGISDYYTRLIIEGKLLSSAGKQHLFGNHTYAEVQASDDLDGDGLKNGQELEITETEKGAFVKLNSYPYLKDSDGDGVEDKAETGTLLSAMKYNASALTSDISWLTNDNNFESYKYLDYYEDSDFAQGAVFIGNVFFSSKVDMTMSYRQKIVNIFTQVDEKVTQLHRDENYRQLVIEYYNGALDVISDELYAYFEAGDETKFTEVLKQLYDMTKEGTDIFKGLKTAPETLVKTIMTAKDIKPLDDLIDGLRLEIDMAPSHVSGDVAGHISKLTNRIKAIETIKGERIDKISVKVSKFTTGAKKFLDIFDKVVFVIDTGITIYENYTNYTDAIAALETVSDNIYILETISYTNDPYLNSAAQTLKSAFESAAAGDATKLRNLAIQDAALQIGAEVLHKVIGTLGAPGAIIEAVRTFGNIVLDATDNAEKAIFVVTGAHLGQALSANLLAHLEGGYAEREGSNWRTYSDYSKEFLNSVMNLIVVRIDAEETFAKWDCMKVSKAEEKQALANVDKATPLLAQFHMKYTYYLSIQ